MTIAILTLIIIGLISVILMSQLQLKRSKDRLTLFLNEALSGNILKRFNEKHPTIFRGIGEQINELMHAMITETELMENKLQEKNLLMYQYIQFLLSLPTAYTVDVLLDKAIEGISRIFRPEVIAFAYQKEGQNYIAWQQNVNPHLSKHNTEPFNAELPSQTYIITKNFILEQDQDSILLPEIALTYNYMQIPVMLGTNLFGIIQIRNKESRIDFDEYDHELGRTIALAVSNQLKIIEIIEQEKSASEKLSNIIDNISDAILITDPKHDQILENPAARDLFSLNPIKKDILIHEFLKTPENPNINLVLFKPERLVLTGKISTIHTPIGTVDKYIISLRNVTDTKQKEREKSELMFLTATKMHQPLLALKKAKELFRFSSDATLESQLTKNINLAFDLLSKVIFYSEIESGPMRLAKRQASVNDIVEKVVDSLGAQLSDKQVDLQLKLTPDLEKTMIDSGRIEEALTSILQFMLRVSEEKNIHKQFVISTRKRGAEYLGIEIFHGHFEFDNMELLELTNKNIQLEKFMQSDQQLEELNLHFAFVNHIVQSHGGSFIVNSEANIGTFYHIELPVA